MNEKINIAELLKDCPKNTKLYSPMFGDILFEKVIDNNIYINTEKEIVFSFNKYGSTDYTDAECLLFPSKENRDWSTFQRPFKDGDIVAFDNDNGAQLFIFKKYIHDHYYAKGAKCYMMLDYNGEICFKSGSYYVERLATEEEKEKLFKAINDNGYKWNAETKTLEELIELKFKDGDIISDKKGNVAIYKKIHEAFLNEPHVDFHCGITSSGIFVIKNDNWQNWGKLSEVSLASEEDKQTLFYSLQLNGYKWNEYTKLLEKLVKPNFKVGDKIVKKNGIENPIKITHVGDKYYYSNTHSGRWVLSIEEQDQYELVTNKFDITTLEPFKSEVLVRDADSQKWEGAFYTYYDVKSNFPYHCTYLGRFKQCIPYKGNEHLLGKTDDCDGYYKTWE